MSDKKSIDMNLPKSIEYVIRTIEDGGFEAYAVGGCVRNRLMGIQPMDYDIATSARPEDIKGLFPKTFDTGIKHGTVTVVADKTNIEVTSFRIDGKYTDGRRPESVVFTSDLSLDLERRDFTMNAIAYGTKTGFVDFCGGMKDIENRLIRGVGEPGKRYGEDALRMLRAIRFAGQLGFEIEKETYKAISDNAALIKNISAERIRDETVKLILSDFPEKLEMMCDTGLAENIDTRLSEYLDKYLARVMPSVKLCEKSPGSRLALLFQYMEQTQLKRLLNLLKFDNKLSKEIMLCADMIGKEIPEEPSQIRRLLSHLGIDAFKEILYLKTLKAEAETGDTGIYTRISEVLEQIIRSGDCISMRQLRIDGDDLKKLGFPAGKRLGEALGRLFDAVLEEPSKNNEELLKAEAKKILAAQDSNEPPEASMNIKNITAR